MKSKFSARLFQFRPILLLDCALLIPQDSIRKRVLKSYFILKLVLVEAGLNNLILYNNLKIQVRIERLKYFKKG